MYTVHMKTTTATKIISYLGAHSQATAKELADVTGISRQALFRQLGKLQMQDQIYKIGTPPEVFYLLKQKIIEDHRDHTEIDPATKIYIDKNYLFITPTGERLEGLVGFIDWCRKTKQPVEKTAQEYVKTLGKYNAYKKNGLIDGTVKLKATFGHSSMHKLYYLDFYSIERFGKTKLGQLLLYAKQSQNRHLIKELIVDIKPAIAQLIKKNNIEAIGFIPPTVKREVQFMKELERQLHFKVAKISIFKIRNGISVPQKTLNKLEDRIENAKKTMVVDTTKQYKNILLIDDAVGSGATLNEIAAQIKTKGVGSGKIFGLAVTGSFKGFDVISEV